MMMMKQSIEYNELKHQSEKQSKEYSELKHQSQKQSIG